MAVLASAIATVVSVVASRRFGTRWRGTGRADPAMLACAIGLGMVALAAVALLVGSAIGFSRPLYRFYHLFGAVLDLPWLALGVVLLNSRDRLASRVTGTAGLLVVVALLPAALRADPLSLVAALLAACWSVVLLDGEPTRVRIGSSLVVAGFSLLALTVVLPAGFTGPLESTGLPAAAAVLPPVSRGFALAGTVVGAVVGIAGAVAAAGHQMWQHSEVPAEEAAGDVAPDVLGTDELAPEVAPGVGADGASGPSIRARWEWRAPGPGPVRDRALANLLVATGISLVAGGAGVVSFLGGITADAIGITVGVVLVAAGLQRARSGGATPRATAGTEDPGAGPAPRRRAPAAPRTPRSGRTGGSGTDGGDRADDVSG